MFKFYLVFDVSTLDVSKQSFRAVFCDLEVGRFGSESSKLIFFALLWLSIIALRFEPHGSEANFVFEVLFSLFRGC